MKLHKKILAFSFVTLFLVVGSIFCRNILKKEYPDIKVSFLKTGKADAIVIRTAEHTVLIDSANAGDGKKIYEFCSEQGYDVLDYFILTHFDQDHVGGAKAVISKFNNVKNILEPDYQETNDEYLKYQNEAAEKGYIPAKIKNKQTFELDGAVFTVYPAMEQEYKSTNDYSLVITMIYGKKSFVFTGDAENIRLGELMQQLPERKGGYDVVKIPHHGISEKKTDDFIEFIKPFYAVICCSGKEPADDKTIDILEKNNVKTYYTYDGTIIFTCNGYKIDPEIQSQ